MAKAKKAKTVSPRERRLIEEFAVGFKLSAAFQRAGIQVAQPKNALAKLCDNPSFKRALEDRQAEVNAERMISEERVLDEIASIGFADIMDYYDEDGTLKSLKDIPPHARRAIVGTRTRTVKTWNEDGKEQVKQVIDGYELADKLGALDRLGKNLKLFTDDSKGAPGNVTNNYYTLSDSRLIDRAAELLRKAGIEGDPIRIAAPASNAKVVDVLPG